MSSAITRISARELSALIHPSIPSASASSSSDPNSTHSTSAPASVLIVDVRDDDRKGGHILNSVNYPSTSLYRQLSRLQQQSAGVDMVVFHCMLSQQRGPAAAAQFAQHMAQQHSQHGTPVPRIAILDKGMMGWVSHVHGRHRAGEQVTHLIDKYDFDTWGYSFKPVAAAGEKSAGNGES